MFLSKFSAGLVLLVEVWASMAGLNGTTTGHRPLPKRETDQTREAGLLQVINVFFTNQFLLSIDFTLLNRWQFQIRTYIFCIQRLLLRTSFCHPETLKIPTEMSLEVFL